jgi:hypothetical protein
VDKSRSRRWVRRLAPTLFLLVAFTGIGVIIVNLGNTVTCSCEAGFNTAAPSNLQNALVGANTYFVDSGHTFTGMFDSASSTTSSIQQIGTGLSFVDNAPSTDKHVISTTIGGGGTYVVLLDFARGPLDCFGILDLTKDQRRTVLGIAKAAGTYFFVIRNTTTSACDAARIKTVSTFSTTGFPGG